MAEKTWLDDPKLLDNVATRIERRHSSRSAENKATLRAYWDRTVIPRAVDWTNRAAPIALYDQMREQRSANLTAEVVDAAVSIVCRDMSAKVIPVGADFELTMGCKEASRLIEGVFDNSEFGDIAAECARDGMSADMGPCKAYVDHETNEIKFARLDPLLTFWVGASDDPRTIITEDPIPRDELIARYPKHKARLEDVKPWAPPTVVGVDLPGSRQASEEDDTVKVVEAWCRAIGESNPGRHAIVCGDVVLEDEPWFHDITPVFRFCWSPDRKGWSGRSLARIVNKYDMANRRLERMLYAGLGGAVPQLLEHEDSETEGPSDMEFGRWKWSGTTEPRIVIPQTVSPEVISKIEKNRERAFAEGGVNQGMATGNAPARYTSGAAQREYVDIANTRLLRAQRQWEKFWRAAGRVVVMLAEQAKRTHVRVKGAAHYEAVKWPRMREDSYRVSFGLSSALPLTPSDRKQTLADWQEMGLIDVPTVARLIGLPDTETEADRLNAPRDLNYQQISMALDKGIPVIPSAMQDLNALIKDASNEWQRARLNGTYPKKNVELLRRLILAAKARLAPPPAPPAPAPMPVPGPEAGAPPPLSPEAPPLDPGAAIPAPPMAALA